MFRLDENGTVLHSQTTADMVEYIDNILVQNNIPNYDFRFFIRNWIHGRKHLVITTFMTKFLNGVQK